MLRVKFGKSERANEQARAKSIEKFCIWTLLPYTEATYIYTRWFVKINKNRNRSSSYFMKTSLKIKKWKRNFDKFFSFRKIWRGWSDKHTLKFYFNQHLFDGMCIIYFVFRCLILWSTRGVFNFQSLCIKSLSQYIDLCDHKNLSADIILLLNNIAAVRFHGHSVLFCFHFFYHFFLNECNSERKNVVFIK